jgi:hypothetical protein
MPRSVTHRYRDPLDTVWVETARRLGLRVVRDRSAYASTDGQGTLTVGVPETLDADDCLAQIIFHELCHALVQGDGAFALRDWGLDNETDRDLEREWACLRAQAELARRYGLRSFLAPTTDHRAYYNGLGEDPLAGDEPCVALARNALGRAARSPWRELLQGALSATARIVQAARPFASPEDLLSSGAQGRAGRHPLGLPLGPDGETCGSCAWLHRWRGAPRCRVAGARTRSDAPACAHWEGALDCHACAACCREAYGLVEIGRREPIARVHPHLVVDVGGRVALARNGDRCAALADGERGWRCTVYEDRPRTCREFKVGGRHCLEARRRVGLSPPAA